MMLLLIIFLLLCVISFSAQTNRPYYLNKDLDCDFLFISATAKLTNDKYFIATTNGLYWNVEEGEPVKIDQGIKVSKINENWPRVDAAIMFNSEVCDSKYSNKLLLLYNKGESQFPEVIFGSVNKNSSEFWSWSKPVSAEYLSIFEKVKGSVTALAYYYNNIHIFMQNNGNLRWINLNCKNEKWDLIDVIKFPKTNLTLVQAAYFDDSPDRDQIALYLLGKYDYYMCYFNKPNTSFQSECDKEKIYPNFLMAPQPHCSLRHYPNQYNIWSLEFHILIIVILTCIRVPLILRFAIISWRRPTIQNREERIQILRDIRDKNLLASAVGSS